MADYLHVLHLPSCTATVEPIVLQALEIAARMAESSATLQKDIRISHSVIPDHFEQEEDGMAEEAFRQSRGAAQVAEFTGS
jgi:hypothetical protein